MKKSVKTKENLVLLLATLLVFAFLFRITNPVEAEGEKNIQSSATFLKEKVESFVEQATASEVKPAIAQKNVLASSKKVASPSIQKRMDFNKEEMDLFAKIIELEYSGDNPEALDSKVAVGLVILNRIESDHFPDNLHDVVFQKNQFQPTFDGSWEKKMPNELDYKAAELALQNYNVKGEGGKSINESLYFMNPKISAPKNVRWFRTNLEYVDTIGSHEFYK